MAEKFYTILTNIGKAKIANSTAFGKKVNLVKFKVGDSNGKYYEPNENQTDLVNPIYEGNINDIEVDADNSNWIKVQLLIPANIGGFTIREYAVYDDENNMIAIAKCAESYKPLSSDGSTKELELEMVIAVTNTETINMQIDPTIIFSTKKDINNLQTQIDKNTASLKEIDNSKANSNHTHDDRYYTENEINDKLKEKVNLTKSNDYNFNDGEGKNNIRRVEVNGKTLTNSPNGNTGGVVFEFVGSHGRWNTQQFNDQQGRMWYRNSSDAYNATTWNPWKEVSLNEKTVNPPLLNGWQYWPDANHGQIFAKNGDFGYVSLTVKKSVSNDNTIIANTPYRPGKRIIACVSAGATTTLECRIEPNGDIRLNGGGYNADGWVAINICYPLKF